MICPNCTRQIPNNSSTCTFCGAQIATTVSAQTTPETTLPPVSGMIKHCPSCGTEVPIQMDRCPKCGAQLARQVDARPPSHRNPAVALVLSIILPGLGQIYNRDFAKGLIFIVFAIILAGLSFANLIGIIASIIYLVFWLYNIYDAYTRAKRINAGLSPTV